MSLFNGKEWQRYQRHVQLHKFGVTGQTALKQAHVLVVGVGGLGCPASQYLGAAGIGHITLVDADSISASNLQRQILFTEVDIGLAKVSVARQRVLANNSHIEVTAINERLTADNAPVLIQQADIVLDCTDNFETRYLINDICLQTQTPWLYASVIQFYGQVALFEPGGACFRCLFPQQPSDIQDCNSAGVLGVMPGLLASLQVNEAIKYLSGLSTPLSNSLMLVEGLSADFSKISLSKDKNCRCNHPDSVTVEPVLQTAACNTTSCKNLHINAIEFENLRQKKNYKVIDVRTVEEHTAFNIGGENIPLSETMGKCFSHTDTIYLLYCQSGARSDQACELLLTQGLNARSLSRGISAWLEEYDQY